MDSTVKSMAAMSNNGDNENTDDQISNSFAAGIDDKSVVPVDHNSNQLQDDLSRLNLNKANGSGDKGTSVVSENDFRKGAISGSGDTIGKSEPRDCASIPGGCNCCCSNRAAKDHKDMHAEEIGVAVSDMDMVTLKKLDEIKLHCSVADRVRYFGHGRTVSIGTIETHLKVLPNGNEEYCIRPDVLFLHEDNRTIHTIYNIIYPACDIAVGSNSEIVVAREQKPVIRVINLSRGDTIFRDINVSHKEKILTNIDRIQCDEVGNMFALYGHYDGPEDDDDTPYTEYLLVLDNNGALLQEIEVGGSAMAYCKKNRILYIEWSKTIIRFSWNGKRLNRLPDWLSTFNAECICVGSDGEVFVSGKVKSKKTKAEFGDIRICRVFERKGTNQVTMRRLNFEDGQLRDSGRKYSQICAHGDKIWLSLSEPKKIEVFQLV